MSRKTGGGATYGKRDLQRQDRQRTLRGDPPPDVDHWRPTTRADCKNGPRPCPFVGCKFNLFLDITPKGGLRVPHGEDPEALHTLKETCALDVADRGGMTLEAVARLQMITRERVRQIELGALERFKQARAAMDQEGAARRLPKTSRQATKIPRTIAEARSRPRPNLSGFWDEDKD